ncbi:unnamed protein product [Enterobius vermicularis]|uniref:Ig-like domain-containing protein n=1 Tax=Enterobius vermicularis TaxID=51028 RepID=A0A0N4UUV5_ENTVE|nr:unnamed protein product [Enterobius vermicularis]
MRWCYLLVCILTEVIATKISSKGRLFEQEEGQSVDFPCNVENLDQDTAVMWKKGHEIIFVDETSQYDDPRFQLKKEDNNFTLTIERLEPFDTSNYTCVITTVPEQSITHNLQEIYILLILVPPSISISPDFNSYVVKAGENVVMKCSGSGNPKPFLSWAREVGAFKSS